MTRTNATQVEVSSEYNIANIGQYMMEAERCADEYPISVNEWFSRNRLSRFNFAALKKVVGADEYRYVLDWGCGNLLWSIGLFPGAEITGVELDEKILEYAKINAQANGVEFYGLLLDRVHNLELNHFDVAVAMGLIELITPGQFTQVFSAILRSLKPGGKLICTLHNWRAFSALYLPLIRRGGYESFVKRLGIRISRRSLRDVELDFTNLGYQVVQSGAYNPYPAKLWSSMPNIGYVTHNKLLAHWYCSQFILLQKPL